MAGVAHAMSATLTGRKITWQKIKFVNCGFFKSILRPI